MQTSSKLEQDLIQARGCRTLLPLGLYALRFPGSDEVLIAFFALVLAALLMNGGLKSSCASALSLGLFRCEANTPQ